MKLKIGIGICIILALLVVSWTFFSQKHSPKYISSFNDLGNDEGPWDTIICDKDSDCVYIPKADKESYPLLVLLDCNKATWKVIDSNLAVADSLDWMLATCHESKNHRSTRKNHEDIIDDVKDYVNNFPVDRQRIYIFGFSGMGSQAIITSLVSKKLFMGAIATCAHSAYVRRVNYQNIPPKHFYLITRKSDWNRKDNFFMKNFFRRHGFEVKLKTTGGKHGPGPSKEVLEGAIWLEKLWNK